MEQVRKVRFTTFINDSNRWQNTQPIEGVFHCWGEFSEINSDGVARWTVAIVETFDGDVYRVPPEGLKFLAKNL